MADPELTQVRAPEPVTITVLRARNLRGMRGDTVSALVKAEFGERTLGESPKVECSAEAPAEFNYNATINITFEDPITLDEIATKPVILTVIEILPKEKKQKEEKTQILGQVAVDLLPLAQGERKHKYTLAINPLPGSPLETLPPEGLKPELDVSISVEEPLLNEAQLNECNLMSITLESLYSTPDAWGSSGATQMYTATLPMPLTGERENTIVFAAGQFKPGVDKEVPNKQKKWAVPGQAQGNAIYIPEKVLAADALEDEDGDFRGKEDREHRTVAEQDKNRITWNIERRCYMDASGSKSFQDKIAKSRYWPVEVYRTGAPSGGKGKKEDEGHISFHGIAYVNLAPLLYPGVQRIRGAYKVVAFQDQELVEKTGRKGSLAEESLRIANGILSRSSSSPYPKPTKASKEDAKAKEPKKGASSIKASDAASEGEGQAVVNAEGQMYTEAKSYIMMEISLQRPLVPKRQPEELARRVAEYIPPRPMFPKRTDGAERAVADFHNQVGNVAALILDEFRDQFGDDIAGGDLPNTHEAMEARRQKLIYHLNSSGKYFAFKEQLKHAVVKIVREKYLKTANFKDKEELQTFLSELYVYLIDQMHASLNKVLSIEDQAPVPEPLTDSAQLKHFAREAEVNENFELASKYYQERIARDRNDPDHWLDYGTFCLYINELTKAEECFKECVSIDQRHLNGLLLYGVVCTMQEKHDAAETFFEAATSIDPQSILAWTMLGLFYDGIGNEIGAEMALLEANKLNNAAAVSLAKAAKEAKEEEARKKAEEEKAREEAARDQVLEATIEEDPTEVASKEGTVVAQDPSVMIKHTSATPTSQSGSDTKLGKASGIKLERKGSALRKSGNLGNRIKSNENIASRPGSVQRARSPGGGMMAEEQEEVPPPREPTPVPSHTIFMHTVDFLLEVKAMPFAERALAHHLLDPMGGPSADYHISLARLRLQKHSLEEAEECLNEALQCDHQNPDAWAIMGHVKYLLGDAQNAKDCYERTLSFIANASEMHSIFLRLASIYLQEGRFEDAKKQFLMACKRSPSCVSWLGVGIACYRLGELQEAEDALSEANILNNTDPEVWAYLSLVCLRTGRQFEAEQAYKYAIKLNLQDEELLIELYKVQEQMGFGNPQL